MPAIETEYKKNPVIQLKTTEDEKFPFTFGLAKAKKVLANIEAIKNFVEKHEKAEA